MMTLDKFAQLLEIYGADATKWPTDLRSDIESFIANNESATALFNEHQLLEKRLNDLAVPEFPNLEQKVLNQTLPPRQQSLLDQLLNWVLPAENFGASLWRPAMAACLPLVFGIVLGNYYSFGIGSEVDEFDYWDDELALLAISDISESEPL